VTEPANFAAAKFRAAENSSQVTVREVLVEMIRQIDAGELLADSMVAAVEHDTGTAEIRQYFTAGSTYGEAYILASHMKARAWEHLRRNMDD